MQVRSMQAAIASDSLGVRISASMNVLIEPVPCLGESEHRCCEPGEEMSIISECLRVSRVEKLHFVVQHRQPYHDSDSLLQ